MPGTIAAIATACCTIMMTASIRHGWLRKRDANPQLTRRDRTYEVNKHPRIEALRTGFWMLPYFESTAHMIHGASLEAAFVDDKS